MRRSMPTGDDHPDYDTPAERRADIGDSLRDERKGEAAIKAFDARKRQAIPVLPDVSFITFATKLIGSVEFTSWTCGRCNKTSPWLRERATCLTNSAAHVLTMHGKETK